MPTSTLNALTTKQSPSFTTKVLNQSIFEIVAELIISVGLATIGGMMAKSASAADADPHTPRLTQDAGLEDGGLTLSIISSMFTIYMLCILVVKLKREANNHSEIALRDLPAPNDFRGNVILSMIVIVLAAVSIVGVRFTNNAVQGSFSDVSNTDSERITFAIFGSLLSTLTLLGTLYVSKQLYHRASDAIRTHFFNPIRVEERTPLLRAAATPAITELDNNQTIVIIGAADPDKIPHEVTVGSYPNLDDEDASVAFSYGPTPSIDIRTI